MVVTATYSDSTTAPVLLYTVTDGTDMAAGKTTVTISYTEGGVTKTTTQAITVAKEYTVTVDGGTGNGKYIAGEEVTISAFVSAGQKFKEWFVGDGKVLRFTESDITSSTAKFVMPGEAVRIEATYEDIPHTHVYDKEVANDTYKATEASCTAKATYYKSCACGAKGTETFAYGELAAHTEGTVWTSDTTHHWHVCTATGCGAVIEESKTPHSFEWIIDRDATETQAGAKHEECSVCDYKKETVEIPATGTGTQPESTPTPAPTAPATPLPTAVPVVQSPKTGDSMSWIWLAVFMVSGLGVVTTIVLGKKSQPDKE